MSPARIAVVDVPTFFWGGVAQNFFAAAKLDARPLGDQWQVRLNEAVIHADPGLVSTIQVLGVRASPDGFERVAAAEATSIQVDHDDHTAQVGLDRLNQRIATMAEAGELAPLVGFLQAALGVAPRATAIEQARVNYNTLRDIGVMERPGEKLLTDVGLQLVLRDPALMNRVMLPAVLVQSGQDPALAAGDLRHLQRSGDPQRLFAAAQGLHAGIAVLDAYVGPLIGAMSPRAWAFGVQRASGHYLYTFGTSLRGLTDGPAELLQVVPTRGDPASPAVPEIGPQASVRTVEWWAKRLNIMFGVVSDLTLFVDDAGVYQPARHLEAFLSVEQIFLRVTSTLAGYRDRDARVVAMLTTFDTFADSLATSRTLENMFEVGYARAALKRVRSKISQGAGQVLLPGAERAVAALEEMTRGFYISEQHNREDVELHLDGRVVAVGRATATAEYLRLLRNATHGYGTKNPDAAVRNAALLAQHDGNIPYDLPLLSYLYLLDLLVSPELLTRSLQTGKR